MEKDPSRRNKRLALMTSGAMDMLIGGVMLLIGFQILPIDLTNYGLKSWYALVLGGVLFLVGLGTFAYNLSRLEE